MDPNGRGVVELWMKLADEVPAGDWTIVAKIMGKEEEKTFTVDDYVLPRFETEVIIPSFGLSYDPLLKITVKATYTFGQPVTDGAVKIAIMRTYGGPGAPILYKKGMLSKDGTLTIEVSTKEIRAAINGDRSLSWQSIKVTADVTERQTGRVQSSTASLQYFDTPLVLRYVNEVAPKNFKPGLPYTIYTEVRKQDGTRFTEEEYKEMTIYFNVTYDVPLTKEEIEENLNASSSGNSGGSVSSSGSLIADIDPIGRSDYMYQKNKLAMVRLDEAQRAQSVPANGWVTLTFDVPMDALMVNIQAWSGKPYKEIKLFKTLSRAVSPSESFLQLHVGTEKPMVGKEFTVTAKATDAMPMLTYQVFAKGALLHTKEVPTGNRSSVDFSFMVTRDMTPTISLVAFYIRDQNYEVVVDALSLSVDGLFQKPITIEFSKQEAEPGDDVEVIVKAPTDSLVYLLSADKSAVLLKGGNDLTQDDVTRDMAEYSFGGGFSPWEFMFICGWPSRFRGYDAFTVLQNAGVVFLSDAWVYAQLASTNQRYPTMPEDAMGGINEAAGPDINDDFKDVAAADVVRKFFPEVWLWEISYITDDSGGQVSIPTTVPDTLTTWITTGFSLHPDFGLSITEKPTELVVSRPMFITLDLPMSIIRGENYCFTATIFSYYNATIPIRVTLDKSSKFSNIHVGIDQRKIKLTTESAYYSYFLGDVEPNEMRSVKYCFVPTELGEIPVKVSALTNVQGLSDAVERIIICKVKAHH
ncbi:hypothetical protein EGW08_002096 [Elysia chlorotica]|uniref:Alpha-2-macroglobulin bait region domain-containing protein n=1 Tax=Elysia chlorotica TaxID=188477 RepID=A0A433U8J4_ELYCH|nr:hypothetical protein EGW08_002096 [Elysia chlorotica]